MITAWRLVKETHIKDAFTGEGARLYGGRWNHRGIPAVYISESLSLAILEQFVHLGFEGKYIRFAHMQAHIPQNIKDRQNKRSRVAGRLEKRTAS